MLNISFAAVLVLGVAFACGPGNAWGAANGKAELVGKLEAIITQAMADSRSPGCITGVWKGGFAWKRALGLAQVANRVPMRLEDIWRIGSVTKTFIATVVLRLCDKKVLSLDDPLAKFVPDFPHADQITVKQLLQHSSGIFSWDEDEATRKAILEYPEQAWTMAKMIRLAAGRPLYFSPGTGHHYSNVGFFLLVPIIEKATGKTVAQVLQEEVCRPLGLNHTWLPQGWTYKGEAIHGYMTSHGKLQDTTGWEFAKVINHDLAHTAGGIVSTLADLKIWAHALASGKLLSARLHREQVTPFVYGGKRAAYGLGVVVYKGWIGHSGGVAGSMCNVYIHPGKDLIVIQYFNKLNPVDIQENTADLKVLGSALKKTMEALTAQSW